MRLLARSARRHWGIGAVLLAFLVLGSIYVRSALPFSKPDERYHYAFVEYVREHHALPVLDMRPPSSQTAPPEQHEAYQPPLFYVVAALVTGVGSDGQQLMPPSNPHYLGTPLGNRNAFTVPPDTDSLPVAYRGFYAGRFLSLLFSAAGILFGYFAILTFAPVWLATFVAALMAFNPEFLYIGTSFSNDALSACLASAGLWCLMVLCRRGAGIWRGALLGLVLGLGILTKLGVLGLVVPYVLLMLWLAVRKGDVRAWRCLSVSLLILGALDGWWFWRNQLVYGDPLTMTVLIYQDGTRDVTWSWLAELAQFAWKSYFVDFGPGAIGLASGPVYIVLSLVAVAGLVGTIGAWFRCRAPRLELGVLICSFAVMAAGYFRLVSAHDTVMGGGRLILPAALPIAAIIGIGLASLGAEEPRPLLPSLAAAGMLAFAILAIPLYLQPLTPRPTVVERLAVPPEHPVNTRFGDDLLLGYDQAIAPNGALRMTYDWLPKQKLTVNYSVFLQEIVHRPDGQDTVLAQLDTYPSYGASPTSFWAPGRYVVDTLELRLLRPKTPLTPGEQLLVVTGLYDSASMKRPALTRGEGVRLLYDQAVIVAEVAFDANGQMVAKN